MVSTVLLIWMFSVGLLFQIERGMWYTNQYPVIYETGLYYMRIILYLHVVYLFYMNLYVISCIDTDLNYTCVYHHNYCQLAMIHW